MIQIDMEMPKNCEYCPLVRHYQNGNVWCNGKNLLMYNTTRTPPMAIRPGWCPLIEIPEMNVGNISEFPNSSTDCISRQAAINALGEEPMVWIGSDYELAQKNQWNLDKLAIETVPSAQPERKSVIYYGDGYADGAIVYDEAECPSCGRVYDQEDFHVWGAPFCPHCGQALDWEGEKDEGN